MSTVDGRSGARVLAAVAGSVAVLTVLAGPGATAAPSPPSAPSASARPLSAIVLPAIGPGYGVTSQGPLDPTTFASHAPDPAAVRQALATLGQTVDTYEQVLHGIDVGTVQPDPLVGVDRLPQGGERLADRRRVRRVGGEGGGVERAL